MNVRAPNLRLHSSGLTAEHDMACAVCHTEKAVYSLNEGHFEPCWRCRSEGWRLRHRDRSRFWVQAAQALVIVLLVLGVGLCAAALFR